MTALTTTNHSARAHAERSASQLGSLVMCPGYRPKPTKKVHWVTAQGTRGHEALDDGGDTELESTFEARMVEMCQRYSDGLPFATREFQEMEVDTIEGRWGFTDRLRIRAKILPEGELACCPVDSDEADLIDWKFVRAKLVVDAEHNLQGKDYVVAIFEDPDFAFLNKIHVHFVMPRFEQVTTHTFTRADIPRLELEIYAVLCRARDTDRSDYDGSTLTPAYETCKYCDAAGNCVALRRIVDRLGRQYDPNGYGQMPPIPEETHASKVKCTKQRAQLQKLAGLVEEWAKSVRAHNLNAALEDEKNLPEGYAIDWAKSRRYVTNPRALLRVIREFGVTARDLLEVSSIGWTRLETLIKERTTGGTKKSAVERFEKRLTEEAAVDRPEPVAKLKSVVET
jgi:hypothetical protein